LTRFGILCHEKSGNPVFGDYFLWVPSFCENFTSSQNYWATFSTVIFAKNVLGHVLGDNFRQRIWSRWHFDVKIFFFPRGTHFAAELDASRADTVQGCQILLSTTYQKWKNVPKYQKLYQLITKYIK
jgi:hypothetical protein